MPEYSEIHRNLLQYFMSRGYVPYDKALSVLNKLAGDNTHSKTLEDCVKIINENITTYHQYIRKTTCEMTGLKCYVFINTITNDISKLQCMFKEKDGEFIRLLLDEILNTEQRTVALLSATNLCSRINGYTADNGEKVIQLLITNGYIYEQNDDLSLGARAICELEPYFREFYTELLTECCLCKELVFCGKTCQSCQELLHIHCINHYLSRKNKCPSCKNDWCAKKMRLDNSSSSVEL